jgi:vacuolar protein sorting-associated protein 13A/C
VQGVQQGVSSLAGGLFKGITGIITEPIIGAREQGAGGFLRGVGKGLLGVVAKPTSGVAGFASGVASGIGRSASRMRPPRWISPDGLQPFELLAAQVHEEREKRRVLIAAEREGR